MSRGYLAAALAVFTSMAAPAFAHHSGAMYEPAKVVTLNGTVMSYLWKNPHAQVDVMIMTAAGQTEQWTMECSTPNILARKGWKNTSFNAGDKVTVTMRPLKDGRKEGLLLTISGPSSGALTDHDY